MKSLPVKLLTPLLFISMLLAAQVSVAGGNTGNKDNKLTALGKSPDWTLEIDNETHKVTFVTDDETISYKYPKVGPTLHRKKLKTVYTVPNEDHVLIVHMTERACQDVETGKAHEVTVVVALDGVGYSGCGDYEHQEH